MAAANSAKNSPHHAGNSSKEFNKELCDTNGRMIIPAQDLTIVWGNDSRYWTLPKNETSPAVLNQVCWLEVTGSVGNTDPGKNYEVGFQVSWNSDAFGWARLPLFIMAKRGKNGQFKWEKFFGNPNENKEIDITSKLMGSGQDPGSESDSKIYFGLYEVWSGKWKGGLNIHHAFVREI